MTFPIPARAKPRFKLTDTGKVRDRGAVGCHPFQRHVQIYMWHPIQIVYPRYPSECGQAL